MAGARKWIMCQYSSHGVKSFLTQTHNIILLFPLFVMCDVRARRACRRFRSPPRWRLEFEDGGGARAAGAHDVQIGAATFGLVEAVRSRCGLGFFADEAL